MPQNNVTQTHIRKMEQALKEQHDLGNLEAAKALAKAIKAARLEAEPDAEFEGPVKKAGRAKSFAKGAARQFGRQGATLREIGQMAQRVAAGDPFTSLPGETDIPATERLKEQQFKAETSEHPGFAFGGEAAALLPFAAGRTPAGAFTRGAVGGGLTFNEDPTNRIIQTFGGGAANRVGLGLLGRANNTNLQSKAAKAGMELLPEQRAPTLFPNVTEGLDAFRSQAFRAASANNKTINREALSTLGEKGDRFTHETFGNVRDRAADLFNAATGSRESVLLGTRFNSKIDALLDTQKKKIVNDARSVKALKRLQNRVDENNGVLTAKEYQDIRSEITTAILQTGKKKKALKRTLGEIVETLDDHAELSLAGSDPAALAKFKEARRLWRQFNLFKTEGVVDFKSGNVNPVKLRRVLRREDETGFLLNKNQGGLYDMLRVDELTPRGAERFDVFGNFADMRVVGGPGGGFRIGRGLIDLIEKPVLGASRLPQRAIEGAPLSLTVPLLKNNLPPRSLLSPEEDTDELRMLIK